MVPAPSMVTSSPSTIVRIHSESDPTRNPVWIDRLLPNRSTARAAAAIPHASQRALEDHELKRNGSGHGMETYGSPTARLI